MMKMTLVGEHFKTLGRALFVQQDDFVPENSVDYDKTRSSDCD